MIRYTAGEREGPEVEESVSDSVSAGLQLVQRKDVQQKNLSPKAHRKPPLTCKNSSTRKMLNVYIIEFDLGLPVWKIDLCLEGIIRAKGSAVVVICGTTARNIWGR